MAMQVGVIIGEMQPHTRTHEQSGDHQGCGQWCAQGHGQGSTDKRSQRKVSAGSRGTEIAERHNKQRQTQAVTHEAE